MSTYLTKLKKIISEKTGLELADITEDSYFEDDLNISEMELMEILDEVEESLHVDISDERDSLESVGELLELLSEKLD